MKNKADRIAILQEQVRSGKGRFQTFFSSKTYLNIVKPEVNHIGDREQLTKNKGN